MSDHRNRYPQLEIDLDRLQENLAALSRRCQASSVGIAGVVKGFTALPEMVRVFDEAGLQYIASSWVEQLRRIREYGVKTPLMLIRIPMLSELPEVAEVADMSLQSELETLRALNAVCAKRGTRHRVILMADLGDLREGFWSREELVDAALEVEYKLDHLELAGVGTNLGCYGSVAATPEKLRELVSAAEAVERAIGRELQYISGGASTSVHMVLDGTLPARVNHLRIGEFALLGGIYGCYPDFLRRDVFTLRMEVVECKPKPSYPVGELTVDAFGKTREYTDRGIRRRALCAAGRVDYGDPFDLTPRLAGVEVLGASSDHTILDVEDAAVPVRLGDVLDFGGLLGYAPILPVSTFSPSVFVNRGGRIPAPLQALKN